MSFYEDNVFPLCRPHLREVEVLDALMGTGKTHAALRYAEESGERWTYCTEFLDEIDVRTKETPQAQCYWRSVPRYLHDKTERLKDILRAPDTKGIAITHALLREAACDAEAMGLLSCGGYSLLLDETLDDLITPYDGALYGDIALFHGEGWLHVDEQALGKIQWQHHRVVQFDRYRNSTESLRRDQDHLHLAIQGGQVSPVYVVDDAIFRVFHRMIVTTYQFDGTLMCAYLAMKGIPWVPCTDIKCRDDFGVTDVRKLIHPITEHDRSYLKTNLTSTWYDEARAEDFDRLKKTLRSIGRNTGCEKKPELFAYTVPGSSLSTNRKNGIQVHGFRHTAEHRVDGVRVHDKQRSCYIPCNARASNDWACKRVMVHAWNRYKHPCLTNLTAKYGLPFSDDRFALNEMIQWVWRSAIRNGEPVVLAVLPKRMRGLLSDWLAGSNVAPTAENYAIHRFGKVAA